MCWKKRGAKVFPPINGLKVMVKTSERYRFSWTPCWSLNCNFDPVQSLSSSFPPLLFQDVSSSQQHDSILVAGWQGWGMMFAGGLSEGSKQKYVSCETAIENQWWAGKILYFISYFHLSACGKKSFYQTFLWIFEAVRSGENVFVNLSKTFWEKHKTR